MISSVVGSSCFGWVLDAQVQIQQSYEEHNFREGLFALDEPYFRESNHVRKKRKLKSTGDAVDGDVVTNATHDETRLENETNDRIIPDLPVASEGCHVHVDNVVRVSSSGSNASTADSLVAEYLREAHLSLKNAYNLVRGEKTESTDLVHKPPSASDVTNETAPSYVQPLTAWCDMATTMRSFSDAEEVNVVELDEDTTLNDISDLFYSLVKCNVEAKLLFQGQTYILPKNSKFLMVC